MDMDPALESAPEIRVNSEMDSGIGRRDVITMDTTPSPPTMTNLLTVLKQMARLRGPAPLLPWQLVYYPQTALLREPGLERLVDEV